MKTSHFLPDIMFGAVVGDTVGSVYEWHNIKYKIDEESMAVGRARFTDDSVMTCAVADGILRALRQLPDDWLAAGEESRAVLKSEIVRSLKACGRRFPRAGTAARFAAGLLRRAANPTTAGATAPPCGCLSRDGRRVRWRKRRCWRSCRQR